jgi:uncharacterized protein YbaA (DUF1428 family)
MALYVDGHVVPVQKKRLAAYRRMSRAAGRIWRELGVLDYRECIADDVTAGKRTSFPRSVKLKPGETVVLGWMTYTSRAHRDRVHALAMKDPRLERLYHRQPASFDPKRMFFGGFKSLVAL